MSNARTRHLSSSFATFVAALAVMIASPAVFAVPPNPPPAPDCKNVQAHVDNTSQTVSALEGTSVTLSGKGTPNGEPVTYGWEQTSGSPTLFSPISNSSNPSVTFTTPQVSQNTTFTFKFTVTSVCDPTKFDSGPATVNVTDNDRPPVAVVSSQSIQVNEGVEVTLDGSGSYDPDGTEISSYSWSQTGGPQAINFTFVSGAIAKFITPSVLDLNGESYKFTLTVTSNVLTGLADEFVNVSWVNDAPVAVASCTPEVNEGGSVTLDGSGSSDPDDGIATYAWTQLLGLPNVNIQDNGAVVTFNAPSLGAGQDGILPFNLTVVDNHGLRSATDCTVLVKDITPPVIGDHANVSAEATSPSGAQVSFDPPTALDARDGALTVSCLPASGSLFGLGTTTVYCSAADASGNTASSSFTITVQDTQPPSFTAPADLVLEATSASGAVGNYTNPSTFDAVSGAGTATCTPASGSTFPIGNSTVTCTATDGAGNTATKSFNVKVQDTTAPVIASHGDVDVEATSAAGAVATYDSPTTTDAVDGGGTATCAPASGTQFPLGDTTVTCNARDAAGNNATATTFKVKVGDHTAPVIAAHADVTAEATSAAGAIVSYSSPGTSDAVDGPGTATCTPASGSQFALGDTPVTCTARDAAGNVATPVTFMVRVRDTTPPVIAAHDDVTVEATSASGAIGSYTSPSTTDAVDGSGTASCSPASGSQFLLGETAVTCNAHDAAGNNAVATTFKIKVRDSTPPVIAAHADITAEATSAAGAIVTYTSPSTTDAVDGPGTATCAPVSGSQFALGNTTVTCTAEDAAHNAATPKSFVVTVRDTTPPALTVPANITAEATSASGATVTFAASATDAVTATPTINCTPASGSTFGIGTTTVTCTATDGAGNVSTDNFTVKVQDTTAPVVNVPANFSREATGPSGAVVTFSVSATDAVTTSPTVSCSPASGSTFALGTTAVSCSAQDAAGNIGRAGFSVTVVDTTPPVVTVPADITTFATGPLGAVVNFTASAVDIVDGNVPVSCSQASGTTFAPGKTTVNCSASDARGNTSPSKSFTVWVQYNWNGFFQPINNTALNTVKAGSAIPAKFSLGGYMGMDVLAAGYPRAVAAACIGAGEDPINDSETLNVASNSFNYDATANQYIYVWKSDKAWAGRCLQLQVMLKDGTIHFANFGFTR